MKLKIYEVKGSDNSKSMKYGAGKVVKGKKQSLHKKRKNEII
jgi:hypothetical protein